MLMPTIVIYPKNSMSLEMITINVHSYRTLSAKISTQMFYLCKSINTMYQYYMRHYLLKNTLSCSEVEIGENENTCTK